MITNLSSVDNTTIFEAGDRFNQAVFDSAIAYYGKTPKEAKFFAKNGKMLPPVSNPQEVSENGKAVWLAVNLFQNPEGSKPATKDITRIDNVTIDFETPAEPTSSHAVGAMLYNLLLQKGITSVVEDSGAGCHIIIPISPIVLPKPPVPLEKGIKGIHDLANDAVKLWITHNLEDKFSSACQQIGINTKLEGMDIARVMSIAGTFRVGNSKPNEAQFLRNGYLRRVLLPTNEQGLYPERVENNTVTQELLEIMQELENSPATKPVEAAKAFSSNIITFPITSSNKSNSVESSLRAFAGKYVRKDRSGFFQALVNHLYPLVGKNYQEGQKYAQLIDSLSGDKFSSENRLDTEFERSWNDTQFSYTPSFTSTPTAMREPEEKAGIQNAGKLFYDAGKLELTDIGNAKRMSILYKDTLAYAKDTWLYWTGKVWKETTNKEAYKGVLIGYAKRMAEAIRLESSEYAATEDTSIEAKFRYSTKVYAHYITSSSNQRLKAAIDTATDPDCLGCDPEDFDTHDNLLNLQNGVLNLGTFELLPHDPSYKLTRISNVEYNPQKYSDLWEKVVNDLTDGDKEMAEVLQIAAGYSLTGSTESKAIMVLCGKSNTGKSKFVEAIRDVLGDALTGGYGANAGTNAFTVNSKWGDTKASNSASPEMAVLEKARIVIASEAGAGQVFNAPLLKNIAGSSRITARRNYKDPITFVPQMKLWLDTNYLPDLHDPDEALFNRLRIFPCTNELEESKQDRDLDKKLKAEKSAILNWMIEGLQKWKANGKSIPETHRMREAKESEKRDSNPVSALIAELYQYDRSGEILFSEFYADYVRFCNYSGEKMPITDKKLGKCLRALTGIDVIKGRLNKTFVKGLKRLESNPQM
ncbi:MAG: hypothetical protein HXX08_05385 [Chloroflexi bacterium]|uniref:Phage/plasmid primase, P4 family n=1 Tax=Candidatus Chlorohelix allophototropha TaxID=3003348 RepID=A0A8T7LTE8_9CHLR|nr:hypothetical protein [Chloroflexota bacterium]WJW67169.1 phage/plasmid primase, P4 family [Chloroflexota bacterium L227-S17]